MEGQRGGSIWVLVEGRLAVTKSGQQVNVIDQPGAIIGEMAVILDGASSASVVAETPCRLRYAADGAAFLRSDAGVATHVASGLARRLDLVTTYLADLKTQYQGAPGLGMVDEVLRRLASRTGPPARPGSARDPDPEY
jgi:CRP-like cAMP-binding protein